MVLVFIFLGIIILALTLTVLILASDFHIEIRDLEINNMKQKKAPGYAIILSLYLFNKIKWISVNLNDEKLRKAYTKMQLEKIDFKKFEKDFKLEDLKIIKNIKPKISYLNLNAKIGTENAFTTAFITTAICIVISILLPYIAIDLKEEKYQYKIEPVYVNKNIYKILFNCIIQVKMVHIINVIYIFLKKGRSDLNERTSNRRSYGYSHE